MIFKFPTSPSLSMILRYLLPRTYLLGSNRPIQISSKSSMKITSVKHQDLHHQHFSSFTFIAEKSGSPQWHVFHLPVLSSLMQLLLPALYLGALVGNSPLWHRLPICTSPRDSPGGRSFPISWWSCQPSWQAKLWGLLAMTLSGWFSSVIPPLTVNGWPS